MKLETKADIGDKVWLMENNKPKEFEISKIEAETYKNSLTHDYYWNVKYGIWMFRPSPSSSEWMWVDEDIPNSVTKLEQIVRTLSLKELLKINKSLRKDVIVLSEREKENIVFEIVEKASLALVDVDLNGKSSEWIREYILENAFTE